MSDLRQRQTAKATPKSPSSSATPRSKNNGSRGGGISVLDIFRVLLTLVVASCGLSYYMTGESVLWGYRPWYTRWPVMKQYLQGPIHLTPTQLTLYNGTDTTLPLYIAVNGSIFDVSANRMVYGPGGNYNFFAGRDATRAFVTGCFQEDLTPDLEGVEEMFIPVDEEGDDVGMTSGEKKVRREQDRRLARARVHKQVAHWEGFFRNHKKYFWVGEVVTDGEGEEKEKRVLCEAARKQRPLRKDLKGRA
ncbi:heme/steroid binding domain protein [Aspergillus campestris IBT 28561]|uniref:Heme/steroid binding domain protein n=1 Tax=Aspergillus campestris (strain IBT 28561) TaxID=1392248 RepID=A0A2I1DH73_ASPC2|nr:heme/steroid binding domain protein [Aspergillus campestris IBT 28561]PKY09220.1 heme/steroid binding domain protein [Aspergillus campestris IBT 28561]